MDEKDVIAQSTFHSKTKFNEELGVTKEYNSENRAKLWDSEKNKNAYKEKFFDGEKTRKDPVTGEILHSEQKAAQNKFHMKNTAGENNSTSWAKHAPETDHIIPLKKIHERNKNNPFLTDSDIKEIANKDHNYTVTSKKFNAAKGERSNISIALDKDQNLSIEGRAKLISDQAKAEILVNSDIAARTTVNATKEFSKGAADALAESAVILMADGTRHLINLAQGKEDIEDAAKSAAMTTAGVAVAGGTNRLISDVLGQSSNKLLSSVVKSGHFNKMVSVAMIITNSAVKYINGETSSEGFMLEITTNGLAIVSSLITDIALSGLGPLGIVTAPVASQIIGYIVTTVACGTIATIKDTFKHIDDYKIKEAQIRSLESKALKEMKNQREGLRNLIHSEYSKWDEAFQEGFDMIICSAFKETYSAEGIADGLDRILGVFGKNVAFKTTEEYESQLDSTLVIKF